MSTRDQSIRIGRPEGGDCHSLEPIMRARLAAMKPKPRCSHCPVGLVLSNGCCDMCGRVTILPDQAPQQ